MKKITCAILAIFIITPCLANIHINPYTVVEVVKEFVPEDNIIQTISEYNSQLKATNGNGIPASKLWNVCAAAGWNIEEPSGMQQCSKFVIALIGDIKNETKTNNNNLQVECPTSVHDAYAEYAENNRNKQISGNAFDSLDEQGKKEAKLRNLCFGASLSWHGLCAYKNCNMCKGQPCAPFPADNVDGDGHTFEQICKWANTDCFTANIQTVADIMKESGEIDQDYWLIVGVDVNNIEPNNNTCTVDGEKYIDDGRTYGFSAYMCSKYNNELDLTHVQSCDCVCHNNKMNCKISACQENDGYLLENDKCVKKTNSEMFSHNVLKGCIETIYYDVFNSCST